MKIKAEDIDVSYEEEWRDIKEYEGLYQVSNYGNVRSLDRIIKSKNGVIKHIRGRIIRQETNDGYKYCSLCKSGIAKPQKVHRLVACAFIPNPQNHPYINHKDENKSNNKVDNLEWCSKWYNEHYGCFHEKSVSRLREKIGRKIVQYTINGDFVNEYDTICDVAMGGFSVYSVSDCLRHKIVSHKGFVFRYKEEPFSLLEYRQKIAVRMVYNNQSVLYDSISEAEKKNKFKVNRLNLLRKKGNKQVFIDGKLFTFLK